MRDDLDPPLPHLTLLLTIQTLLMSGYHVETLPKDPVPRRNRGVSSPPVSSRPSSEPPTGNLSGIKAQRLNTVASVSSPHLQNPEALERDTRDSSSSSSSSPSSSSTDASNPRACYADQRIKHKPEARDISPHSLATMSTTKYTQELDRERREPMIAKKSDSSRSTKENSIRQKLRTYEAVLALSEGYMPTTEQITAWARYALRASGVLDSRDRRLSAQGRGFVRDVRAWIEAVVELGLSKNVCFCVRAIFYEASG